VGFATAWASLRTFIGANWSTTAVKYPNVPFAEPAVDPWVAVNMNENTNGGMISIGPATAKQLYRYYGFLSAQIFTLEDKGQEQALALADQWKALFGQGIKRFTVSADENLDCVKANTIVVGNNNGRFQVNVLIEYQRDQFITGG